MNLLDRIRHRVDLARTRHFLRRYDADRAKGGACYWPPDPRPLDGPDAVRPFTEGEQTALAEYHARRKSWPTKRA